MSDSSKDAETEILFREIEEEDRQEKLVRVFKEYVPYVAGGLVTALAIVGGWNWWQSSKTNALARSSSALVEASELIATGETDQAIGVLRSLGSDAAGPYPYLAQIALAQALQEQGQTTEAIGILDAVAVNNTVPDLARQSARLGSMRLKIGSEDLAALTEQAQPLLAESSPWRFAGHEALALAALDARDFAAAQTHLEAILNAPQVDPNLRARADRLYATVPAYRLQPDLPQPLAPAVPDGVTGLDLPQPLDAAPSITPDADDAAPDDASEPNGANAPNGSDDPGDAPSVPGLDGGRAPSGTETATETEK